MTDLPTDHYFLAAIAAVHTRVAGERVPPQLFVGLAVDHESKLLSQKDAEELRASLTFGVAALPWGEAVVEVSNAYPEHLRHLHEMPPKGRVLCIVSANGGFFVRLMPDTLSELIRELEGGGP